MVDDGCRNMKGEGDGDGWYLWWCTRKSLAQGVGILVKESHLLVINGEAW